MRSISMLLLALALASPTAVAADGASAQALLKRIASDGGRKVLWDLWEHERQFDQVVSGIESGDPSWLKVAVALKPFSDAGASPSINYAVARALPNAPERVLALTTHGFNVEEVCTSPFIEPALGVAEAYERRALAAPARMKGTALAPVAAACAVQVRLPDGA